MAKKKIPKARLFISIALPNTIKETMRKISRDVKKQNLIEGKWVKPEHQHITLQFLGYIPIDVIPQLQELLDGIAFEPFRITLGPIGLNDRSNPRVLWVEAHSPMLDWLATEIAMAISLFVEPEERPFHGHITLARIKKVHNQDGLEDLIDSYVVPKDSWAVEGFSLMESKLDRAGAEYETIKEFTAS